MDHLLQFGQVDRNAIWQAVDPQRRLVRLLVVGFLSSARLLIVVN